MPMLEGKVELCDCASANPSAQSPLLKKNNILRGWIHRFRYTLAAGLALIPNSHSISARPGKKTLLHMHFPFWRARLQLVIGGCIQDYEGCCNQLI